MKSNEEQEWFLHRSALVMQRKIDNNTHGLQDTREKSNGEHEQFVDTQALSDAAKYQQ